MRRTCCDPQKADYRTGVPSRRLSVLQQSAPVFRKMRSIVPAGCVRPKASQNLVDETGAFLITAKSISYHTQINMTWAISADG